MPPQTPPLPSSSQPTPFFSPHQPTNQQPPLHPYLVLPCRWARRPPCCVADRPAHPFSVVAVASVFVAKAMGCRQLVVVPSTAAACKLVSWPAGPWPADSIPPHPSLSRPTPPRAHFPGFSRRLSACHGRRQRKRDVVGARSRHTAADLQRAHTGCHQHRIFPWRLPHGERKLRPHRYHLGPTQRQ